MFITEEQATNRLNSDRNIVRSVADEIINARHGLKTLPRATKQKNFSDEFRTVVGTIAAIDGPKEASRVTGVSYHEASRLGLGKDYKGVDENLKERVNKVVDKEMEPVRTKAVSLLTQALDKVTDEKLEHLSAVRLVAVAKGLSSIIKDTRRDNEDTSKYSFNIINVPVQKTIEAFDIVQHREVIDTEAVA